MPEEIFEEAFEFASNPVVLFIAAILTIALASHLNEGGGNDIG